MVGGVDRGISTGQLLQMLLSRLESGLNIISLTDDQLNRLPSLQEVRSA